ncbi:hypothetical protein DUNSADRAFT_11157 [Dunaliella salina]|uniref:Uncharacterized protein n=1 Tax=Dunaliella salina TaxID=3046 RepID=A0ABQ7GE14_DUNSA|nr:hypothetical protein DUNSADRAFT_11157 [Dunaliella salina]|eukprot:KAF5832855.1 hypothetical protein DUNSADRAFT_11157 [Dunaliella salina]
MTVRSHLLRRCRILSSIRIGDLCQQRVALTACSGAESTFAWKLVRRSGAAENQHGRQEGWSADASAHKSKPSQWLVESVSYCKDMHGEGASGKAEPPTVPHPRLAPEIVIQSQLFCLQQGDVQGAERFCDTHRLAGGEQGGISLRRLIRQEHFHRLLTFEEVVLGEAALPEEGVFIQAVHLEGKCAGIENPERLQILLQAGCKAKQAGFNSPYSPLFKMKQRKEKTPPFW